MRQEQDGGLSWDSGTRGGEDYWRHFERSSVQSSRSVVADSLRPHEPQHARPPCPSPTPESTQTHVHWVSEEPEEFDGELVLECERKRSVKADSKAFV